MQDDEGTEFADDLALTVLGDTEGMELTTELGEAILLHDHQGIAELAGSDIVDSGLDGILVQIGIHTGRATQLVDVGVLSLELATDLVATIADAAIAANVGVEPRTEASGHEDKDERTTTDPDERPVPADRPAPLAQLHHTRIDQEGEDGEQHLVELITTDGEVDQQDDEGEDEEVLERRLERLAPEEDLVMHATDERDDEHHHAQRSPREGDDPDGRHVVPEGTAMDRGIEEHLGRNVEEHALHPVCTAFEVRKVDPEAERQDEGKPGSPVPDLGPQAELAAGSKVERRSKERKGKAQGTLGEDGQKDVDAEHPLQAGTTLDVGRRLAIGIAVGNDAPEGVERQDDPHGEEHLRTDEERHGQLQATGEQHDGSQQTRLAAIAQTEATGVVTLDPAVHDREDHHGRHEREEQRDGDHVVVLEDELEQGDEPDVERHDVGERLALPMQAEEVAVLQQLGSQADITKLRGWSEVTEQHCGEQCKEIRPVFVDVLFHDVERRVLCAQRYDILCNNANFNCEIASFGTESKGFWLFSG